MLFGINGWPLFPYVLSATGAHRYRPNGNRVKTHRSIDPVLNDVTSRLAIYSDPVFEFFRNDSRILKRLTRWERNDKLTKYDRI